MTAMEQALRRHVAQPRDKQNRPYLLVTDVRGYFVEAPAELRVDGEHLLVHICANEFSLRRYTEHERQEANPPARIVISRQQLQPDHLPDLQVRSSVSPRTVTGCDIAKALGVQTPRALLDRLPIPAFWNLAPFLPQLGTYGLERVVLASLLNDPSVLSAGWEPDRVLDKLWYEDALTRVREVLGSVDAGRTA